MRRCCIKFYSLIFIHFAHRSCLNVPHVRACFATFSHPFLEAQSWIRLVVCTLFVSGAVFSITGFTNEIGCDCSTLMDAWSIKYVILSGKLSIWHTIRVKKTESWFEMMCSCMTLLTLITSFFPLLGVCISSLCWTMQWKVCLFLIIWIISFGFSCVLYNGIN